MCHVPRSGGKWQKKGPEWFKSDMIYGAPRRWVKFLVVEAGPPVCRSNPLGAPGCTGHFCHLLVELINGLWCERRLVGPPVDCCLHIGGFPRLARVQDIPSLHTVVRQAPLDGEEPNQWGTCCYDARRLHGSNPVVVVPLPCEFGDIMGSRTGSVVVAVNAPCFPCKRCWSRHQ